jgi:hypothetical protein
MQRFMTKRFLLFPLLALLAIVWASCTKETDGNYYAEATRGYYPLQLGRYVIYDVDSVIWDDFKEETRTRHLNIRYRVADTFTDNSNRPSYRVDVHERANVDSAWRVNQVFYVTPTTTGIEVVMQNLRFQKMVFPVSEGRTWFGNKAIDTTEPALRKYGGWVYRYSNFLKPYNNGRATFDNSVTVTAINDSLNNPETMTEAYAERNFFREVYGYDVGLIYREAIFWVYDPNIVHWRKGYSVTMRATEWGQ